MKRFFLFLLYILTISAYAQKHATVTETTKTIKTYPYSDPSPFPVFTEKPKLYPYNKIEGYSFNGEDHPWKVIVLENDYIIVWVMPEIGGKIWGAIEKSTGKDFIYKNDVIKFRNIALRGPWTMGGIELNFGTIGHTPSTASNVDYATRENADGSVSCIVGNTDLPSGTKWRVEVRLPADKAYFETRVFWYNPTELNQSYYNWMTGTGMARQDLEFYAPGNHYMEHSGELKPWPVDDKGRKISVYKENNFGPSKSYHVVGAFENFFGGYYHDWNFGFGHWSLYEEMPGKKIWLWTLSRAGGIWEDLATDTHGQHIEFQAGRMFNQRGGGHFDNPIRHVGFSPFTGDRWTDIWFPVKEIGGISAVSPYGVMYVTKKNGHLAIGINALQDIRDTLYVKVDNKVISKDFLMLKPMEVYGEDLPLKPGSEIKVVLGNDKLFYTTNTDSLLIKRPLKVPESIHLSERQGLVDKGMDFMNYREYRRAFEIFGKLLEKDSSDRDALVALSELYYRRGEYDKSLRLSNRALMQNTFDDKANYLAGISYREKGDFVDALESLGWAARSITFRSAAYEEMAEIYVRLKRYQRAVLYVEKSLDFNRYNVRAYETGIIANRLAGNETGALIRELLEIDPLNHLADYETCLNEKNIAARDKFINEITNEFPGETYLQLALFYYSLGLKENAIELLSMSPSGVMNTFWQAYISRNDYPEKSDELLAKAVAASPAFVFPYRRESMDMLKWAGKQQTSWKPDYYTALLYKGLGRDDEAIALLNAQGDRPDYWVFYATRAALSDEDDPAQQEKDLLRANELAPESWRTWDYLIRFYLKDKKYDKAVAVAKKADKKFSDNYNTGFLYAKTLLRAGNYQQCVHILRNIEILPSEGARESRRVYEEAYRRWALQLIGKKKYKTAVKVLHEALEWPENIGVGKPYDPEERETEYLLAYSYQKLGDKKLADEQLEKIIDYTMKTIDHPRPEIILGLLALKERGKTGKADALLSRINQSAAYDNELKRWINDQYENPGKKVDDKNGLLTQIAGLASR